ncbi:hypothetical protein COU76_04475 [Candidatus Peregrinibacteria bacterium CG10_big_fil_rev_8_21_14_0_10_49_10]|nr:MAG: hypothetical protein COU76_04475 [Candidatus Peregrinibacteria bacterium CG10_big_fil_rev_8_21_14_0_10_49_10]
MKTSFLKSTVFWKWTALTALLCGFFFAWELGMFPALPSLPRPPVTQNEILYSIAIAVLISFNAGLLGWKKATGTCPVGSKRAAEMGGVLGAAALLCPVCLIAPLTLFGVSISLSILGPFLPLLRVIALVLLIASGWMVLVRP